MNKKRLKKAPLIYVQAQFNFSDLPSANIGTEGELENLHTEMMDIGLADRINSHAVQMGFQLNQDPSKDGYFEVKHEKNDMTRLIFRGFGNRRAVELMRNRLVIKVTDYVCYEDFKQFVESILIIIESNIGVLQKVLSKGVSLRYLDVILPSDKYTLKDYIQPALLPFYPEFANQTVGMSQSVSDTGINKTMTLVMEEAKPAPSGLPDRWLSSDLMEPDPQASLTIVPIVENYSMGKNYGILSLEHKLDLPNTPTWDKTMILDELDGLYRFSSSAFWQAITEEAKQEWGVMDGV